MSLKKMELFSDEWFMREALREARKAEDKGEVPVGAVVAVGQKIIARGHNLTETLTDVTAHAEMQAITSASHALGGKFLNEAVLYVTLEPCIMCAGAIRWARFSRVVFGAYDTKYGFSSANNILSNTEVTGGVMEEACRSILKDFFQKKRKQGLPGH